MRALARGTVGVIAAATMLGCASTTGSPTARGSAANLSGSRWADSVLATLTLRQKAAQLVWPFTLGDYVPDDSRAWRQIANWIQNDGVGGFIVSVGSPIEIAAKINRMQSLAKVPMLISADYETGTGFRVRGGYFLPNAIDLGGGTVFPPEMAIGATGDTAFAYAVGVATAREGRALGVEINFAPVLDVNNNPGNPIINTRSYGEDPHQVARFGAAMIHGVQAGGMIATGKHFPGHGDTETNSHIALPVINASRERLDSVELVPFRAAVKSGVGAIMSFHGVLPAFDSSGVPATLSPIMMTGLLRGDLGFRGLIISDAMDMKGGLIQFGLAEAVKRGIAAGLDVILQPSDVKEAIDAIVAGVNEGRYTESRLNESVLRVLRAKETLDLPRNKLADLTKLPGVVSDSAKLALAGAIAERSITLAKDSLHQLPLAASPNLRVLSITLASRTDLGAGVAFNAELRARYPALREEIIATQDPGTNYARLLKAADSADVVIVSSYVAVYAASINASQQFTSFVGELVKQGRSPIVVAFGNPYLLQQIPTVGAYMVAWAGAPALQQAAARALVGTTAITGRLPISIPPYLPIGVGITLRPRSQ